MLIGGASLQQIDLRYVTSRADFTAAVKHAAGAIQVTNEITKAHPVQGQGKTYQEGMLNWLNRSHGWLM